MNRAFIHSWLRTLLLQLALKLHAFALPVRICCKRGLEGALPDLHRLERMCCCNSPAGCNTAGYEGSRNTGQTQYSNVESGAYPRVVAILKTPSCPQKGL
jgi:hypothetical protein